MSDHTVVAADIGASKVVVAVGRRTGSGVELVGLGAVDARPMRRGNAVSMEEIGECIRMAVEEAEITSGIEIDSIDVAIRPTAVRGATQDLRAEVRGGTVESSHVRALEGRPAVERDGQVSLFRSHVGYRVDDDLVSDAPIGRAASRLARREYVVWSSRRSLEALVKSAGSVKLGAVAPSCVAAAWGVTTLQQRDRGVVVVDQGAGSTSVAIFRRGALVHAAVVPVGGEDLTRNVAVSLRTAWDVAEAVKVNHASATTRAGDADAEIVIPASEGRPAQRRKRALLGQIIEPRLAEVLGEVRREVDSVDGSGMMELIVTGGSTVMPGFADVAEQVFGREVQLGIPGGCDGHVDLVRHPKYAAVVGMLLLGSREAERSRCGQAQLSSGVAGPRVDAIRRVLRRLF